MDDARLVHHVHGREHLFPVPTYEGLVELEALGLPLFLVSLENALEVNFATLHHHVHDALSEVDLGVDELDDAPSCFRDALEAHHQVDLVLHCLGEPIGLLRIGL